MRVRGRKLWEPLLLGAIACPIIAVVLGAVWWEALLAAVVGGPIGLLVAARNEAIRQSFGHDARWFRLEEAEGQDGETRQRPRPRIGLAILVLLAGVLAALATNAAGGGAIATAAAFVVGALLLGVATWLGGGGGYDGGTDG